MSKFWRNKIKDTNIVATKLGVDKSKIEELKNGDREIKGETMDKVLNVINETKAESKLRKVEILQWYKDSDLKELREDFGYKTQKELAEVLGCDISTLWRFENKKSRIKGVSKKLEQLYYFYKNDFNRKLNTKNEPIVYNKKYTNKEKDLIFNWYNNTDIKSLRGKRTLLEQSKEIGIPASSLHDIEHKKSGRLTNNIIKVYDFYNKETIIEAEPILSNEEIEKVKDIFIDKPIEEDTNAKIIKLEEEITKLKRQIYLYEKLIERL